MYRNRTALAALMALYVVATAAGAQCTAGHLNVHAIESTPTSNFADNGDGTVTDNLTGLMWKKCVQGLSGAQCGSGSVLVLDWRSALAVAISDGTAGYGDWRLPNKKELESIVETCGSVPAINQTRFPATPVAYFWTSTTYARTPDNAWYVHSDNGNTSYFLKTSAFAVRLVRSGAPPAAFDIAPRQLVVEYINTADFPNSPGGHFFYSSDAAEQQAVDAGAAGRFGRTGRQFLAGGARSVCRFYGSVTPGPNSHFFTVDTNECNALRAQQATPAPVSVQQWNYEGIGFATTAPLIAINGTRSCPAGTQPTYRAYNNAFPTVGPKNPWDSNHRYSLVLSDIAQLVAAGWRDEGIVFCSTP